MNFAALPTKKLPFWILEKGDRTDRFMEKVVATYSESYPLCILGRELVIWRSQCSRPGLAVMVGHLDLKLIGFWLVRI